MEPDFRLNILPFLKRGFLVALVHVRGGGELGTHWHKQGSRLLKKNSFKDFQICVNFLITKGLVNAEKIAGIGMSAGGMVLAGVLNQFPGLLKCAVLKVPFLDCLTSMLDEDLELTKTDQPEWGDPIRDPQAFESIQAYSPYENLSPRTIQNPSVMIVSGLKDERIPLWQHLKYMAKVRELQSQQTEPKNWICKMIPHRGHIEADEDKLFDENSLQIAFVLSERPTTRPTRTTTTSL
jgi:protease II